MSNYPQQPPYAPPFISNGQFVPNQSATKSHFLPPYFGTSTSYQINNSLPSLENNHLQPVQQQYGSAWNNFNAQSPFQHQINQHHIVPNPPPFQNFHGQNNIHPASSSQTFNQPQIYPFPQAPFFSPSAAFPITAASANVPLPVASKVEVSPNIDREDGELSDSDGTTSHRQNPANQQKSSKLDANARHLVSKVQEVKRTNSTSLSNPVPILGPSQTQSNENPATKRHDDNFVQNGNDTRKETQRAPKDNQRQPLVTDKLSFSEFIDLLYHNNYGFNDLLKEDLDPEILAQYYKNLSLNIPTESSRRIGTTAANNSADTPKELPLIRAIPNVQVDRQSAETSGRLPTVNSRVDQTPQLANVKTSKTTTTPNSDASTPVASAPLEIQTGTSSNGDDLKPQNQLQHRKDYIARLMAAKTGKVSAGATNPSVDRTQSASTIHTNLPSAPLIGGVATDITDKAEVDTASRDALLEKKKAQTELARKKMILLEASKRSAVAKERVNGGAMKISLKTNTESQSNGTDAFSDLANYGSNNKEAFSNSSCEPETNGEIVSQSASSTLVLPKAPNGTKFKESTPGLSLNSISNCEAEAASVEDIYPSGQADISTKNRKRPVASDFDDFGYSNQTKSKRQFGQPRHERSAEEMIIEVTDDESEDESMEDVDDGTSRSPSAPGTTPRSLVKVASGVDTPLQLGSKIGILKGVTAPTTPDVTTPPALQAANNRGGTENLSRKEQEILALKKKIAEMEMKKRKGKTSGDMTPSYFPSSKDLSDLSAETDSDSGTTTLISQNQSAKIPKHSDITTRRAFSTPSTSLPSSLVAGSLGAATDTTSPLWRTQRREKIQSDLPALEAALRANMTKLEKLRREMAQLEEESQEQEVCKSKWVEELKTLDAETSPVADSSSISKTAVQPTANTQTAESDDAKVPKDSIEETALVSVDINQDQEPNSAREYEEYYADLLTERSNPATTAVQQTAFTELSDASDDSMDMSEIDSDQYGPPNVIIEDSRPEETLIDQRESRKENLHISPDIDAIRDLEDDSDDFYSSEPTHEVRQQGEAEASRVSTDTNPERAEEHSVASSLNNSEYNIDLKDQDDENNVFANVSNTRLGLVEGAEILQAQQEETIISSKSTESLDPLTKGVSSPHTSLKGSDETDADNLAHDAQNESTVALPIANDIRSLVANASDAKKENHFTPYESPLRKFKAYRYHSEFAKDVTGAFRSMTYSHKIDSMTELCRFEAAGGICNDSQCPFQHFRDMSLSDDMMLVQLGTDNPGGSEEEQKQWTDGLRLVLKDLRHKNTKDPDVVATAISNYRREFLKDPTQVLKL